MPSTPGLRILAIDTTTSRGSIALLQGSEVAAELRLFSMETHSSRLLRSMEFLLQSIQWSQRDLHLVAVGSGPGSFTGIRIGVATALGLAQTLQIPFAAISCLDALAHRASMLDGRIGVVVDAQRSQVYYAEYESRQGKVRRSRKAVLIHPEELGPYLKRRRGFLIGDGALRYGQLMGILGNKWPRLAEVDLFLAASVGRLALNRKRFWSSGKFLQAEPLYIRPPDALLAKTIRRKKTGVG
jgi:tRNA threonylcarbamoyladenosine biosynthesis protein TsaB